MVFTRLNPTKGRKAVSRSNKVFWCLVLFVTTLALVWWTLATLLSVREFQGAKIVRLWWRMSIFAQILGNLVFEPLSIFIFAVLFPAFLAPKLKQQHEFPWRTSLADQPTLVLAEECKSHAPIISERITRHLVRGCAQRHLVPADVPGGALRRTRNRSFRIEQWDADQILETVNQWRRPNWAKLPLSVFTLFLFLEENLQTAVVDEVLKGIYMCLAFFLTLPATLGAVVFQHVLVVVILLFIAFAPWRYYQSINAPSREHLRQAVRRLSSGGSAAKIDPVGAEEEAEAEEEASEQSKPLGPRGAEQSIKPAIIHISPRGAAWEVQRKAASLPPLGAPVVQRKAAILPPLGAPV